jgi:decaprenyl-diphosphate synthase subunit 1
MIMRRFSNSGDVERAFELIVQSDGLQRTKELAQQYCDQAINQLQQLTVSPYQQALVTLTHHVLHRMK